MPLYHYECPTCQRTLSLLRQVGERDDFPSCQECHESVAMSRIPALPMPATVCTTVDATRNKKHLEGQEEMLRKRAKDHFLAHELPEVVSKVDRATAERNGWIKDGKLVRKGDA